ncbi:hypothetical protein AB1Y20_004189 [Prymnesium parvum]|uniref:Uncharacterized protein n=1 Tax=Prymnesium parvum TaxID=97485 RepID=A0AB34J755_PRYPA
MAASPKAAPLEPSLAEQLAFETQRNRELTRTLRTLRGEPPPPAETGAQSSAREQPVSEEQARSWSIYASMPGVDSLYSGLSKRTPTGGFFSS